MKQRKRQTLSLVLAFMLFFTLSSPSVFADGKKFNDVKGHWAQNAIERWSDYDIIQGYGEQFRPDEFITRAQMATILAATLGLAKVGENPFADVASDAWYTPYILMCYEAGIMVGDGSKAMPEELVTREQAMVMLCKALEISPKDQLGLSGFKDADQVSSWAAPYVSAMVESGIVSGMGNGELSTKNNMNRASVVSILDKAILQYIKESGNYKLTDKNGIILVAAGDVTLSGATSANIIITPKADGKDLLFDNAIVTGSIYIQAVGMKISTTDSKLPEPIMVGKGNTIISEKPATGGGGGAVNNTSDLTITEPKTIDGETYKNVTIASSVGDGTVTLKNVNIQGRLIVKGGGSSSVNLNNCTVSDGVSMEKDGGEPPRLNLVNTPVSTVDIKKTAILEADSDSKISAVTAKADTEIKGESTVISTLTIPKENETPTNIQLSSGSSIENMEAKGKADLEGSGKIGKIIVEDTINLPSNIVDRIEVSAAAAEGLAVSISGDTQVEVIVNATGNVNIQGGENITVSTEIDTPLSVIMNNDPVSHIHKWGTGLVTKEASCSEEGVIEYKCTAGGCSDPVKTKHETIGKIPHTIATIPAVDATCETPGKTEGTKCSVCDTIITAQVDTPAIGHDWGAWQTDNEENHIRICNNDASHKEIDKHNWSAGSIAKEPTCDEPGTTKLTCLECGAENNIDAPPALGHDYDNDYTVDVEASCHEAGSKSKHCSRCDSRTEVVEIPILAHSYGDWIYKDETDHERKCTMCEEAKESQPHTWDMSEITKEPTELETGIKTFTCSTCGGTKVETLPVISDTDFELYREGLAIKAKWSGFSAPSFAIKIIDKDNSHVATAYTNPGATETADLALYIPTINTGEAEYSLELYSIDEASKWEKVATMNNAIKITIEGSQAEYQMAFNQPEEKQHTLSWIGEAPEGIQYASTWYRDENTNGSGCGSITPTLLFHHEIKNKDVFDLRIITNYELDDTGVKKNLHRISKFV